jgi:hypothetical protein
MKNPHEKQQRALEKSCGGRCSIRTYVVKADVLDLAGWRNPGITGLLLEGTMFWEYPNGVVLTYYADDVVDGHFYADLAHAVLDHRVGVDDLELHWGQTALQRLSAAHLDPNDYSTMGIDDAVHRERQTLSDCLTPQAKGIKALERSIRLRLQQHRGWQRDAVREIAELIGGAGPLEEVYTKAEALVALIPEAAE